MQSAQANHDTPLLFPYVVKDTNRTTVVTLIGQGNPVANGPEIHLQYWTKSTTDANTAACQPSSTTMTFTDNDIVTFDTAGLAGAGPLFGDTTNLAPLGTSISYPGPRHGYLLAEWLNAGGGHGYWLEVDLANGGAHGDFAYSSGGSSDFSGAIGNLSLQPYDGTPGFGGNNRSVPFWPASVVSTVFTVTPLGTAMATNDNSQVVMHVRNANGVQGAYDRNENGVDGTVPQTVRCVGRLTAAQLMPGVVANASWAATGGWGFLVNLGNGDTNFTEFAPNDLPAAMYQVDTSNVGGAGKFMDNAIRIVNNHD